MIGESETGCELRHALAEDELGRTRGLKRFPAG